MSTDGPIYDKYHVLRTDLADANPESKHYGGCRYFVLDLDHDRYAIEALRAYSVACAPELPVLASALMDMALEMDEGLNRE